MRRSCQSFVVLGFGWRKTNRTIRWLVPSAVCPQESWSWTTLSSEVNDWRNREHVCVCAVLRMSKWWNLKQAWVNVHHDSLEVARCACSALNVKVMRNSKWWTSEARDNPTWANFGKQNWRWTPVPCVSIQNVTVCTFITSPCVPAPRVHFSTHVRVVPAYTETFWMYTRRRSWSQIRFFPRFFSVPQQKHKHTPNTHQTHHDHQQHHDHNHTQHHTETERKRRQRETEKERQRQGQRKRRRYQTRKTREDEWGETRQDESEEKRR